MQILRCYKVVRYMIECEKCGDVIKAKDVCYLKTVDLKTKEARILKVCRECKYGSKK